MQKIPPLPLSVRKSATALGERLTRAGNASAILDKALPELKRALGGQPDCAAVERQLAQVRAVMNRQSEAQSIRTRKLIRSHLEKVGISEGATLELEHPLLSPEVGAEASEKFSGKATRRLRVNGFVARVRESAIAIDVVGKVQRSNRGAYSEEVSLRLEPGFAFKVVRPSP
jgi:hypothetical protein